MRIPEDYIGDSSQRLRMYKRISSAPGAGELDTLRQELVDRFGKYPDSVEHLFRYAELRQTAIELAIQSIERSRSQVLFRFVEQSKVDPQKLLALVRRNKQTTFSPGGVLALDLGDARPPVLFDSIRSVLEEIRA